MTFFTADLVQVEILTKRRTHPPSDYINDDTDVFAYDSYIYRTDEITSNYTEKTSFTSPPYSELKSVRLYNRQAPEIWL